MVVLTPKPVIKSFKRGCVRMWIRITFSKMYNGRFEQIREYFKIFLLQNISESLRSSIYFRVKGAGRQTMTIYGLTEHDAAKAYRIASREKDGMIVTRVQLIEHPTHEEEPDQNFIFAEPELDDTMRERIRQISEKTRAGMAGYFLYADVPFEIQKKIR